MKAFSATMSSTYGGQFPGEKCIDGRVDGGLKSLCHTQREKSPWLALNFGASVNVHAVVIHNRGDCCGNRLRNVEVRVADQRPNSGQQKFTGGQLLGTFKGPARNGEVVVLFSSVKTGLDGRFVIIQSDNSQGTEYLNLHEVTVYGNIQGISVKVR